MRAIIVLVLALPCLAQPTVQPKRAPDYKKLVATRVTSVLDSVDKETDFARASKDLGSLFDELIAFAPANESEAFKEAAQAVRMVNQLSKIKKDRMELFKYLRANPQLAEALVFLVEPEDKIPALYDLLDKLRIKDGKDLNRLASLTAAICVVHDQPLFDRMTGNGIKAADPVQIFEYFRDHEKRMYFPLAAMPAELLVNVVDTTASINDLNWALSKYGGDGRVGRRYSDVRYDTAFFRTGENKKLKGFEYTLPNILAQGGICADQSYFAAQVGKALGIPSASIVGQNAEMGHAWVGFFEVISDKPRWNFDSGHYDDYEDVRGSTPDPQTRRDIADSALCLIVDSYKAGPGARAAAIAMADASLRLAEVQKSKSAKYPPSGETVIPIKNPAREASLAGRLELLEAGLRRSPSYAAGWKVLMAAATELTTKDRQYWSQILESLCGDKYPDFTLEVYTAMVKAIPDLKDQDSFWNSLCGSYQKRPDLAAEVRFCQGAMWEKAGKKDRAWECYQDVLKRFPNEGPFAVDAAERCERLLKSEGKPVEVSPFYASLWPKMKRPSASIAREIKRGSNWYRVGNHYAQSLEAEGNKVKAEEVRRTLDR